MSSTDNVIHLVLVTCYNILIGAASKIDDARLVMIFKISHDNVAVSKSDTPETLQKHALSVISGPTM